MQSRTSCSFVAVHTVPYLDSPLSSQIKSRPALQLDRSTMKLKTKPFKKKTMVDKMKDASNAASEPFEMKMPSSDTKIPKEKAPQG